MDCELRGSPLVVTMMIILNDDDRH